MREVEQKGNRSNSINENDHNSSVGVVYNKRQCSSSDYIPPVLINRKTEHECGTTTINPTVNTIIGAPSTLPTSTITTDNTTVHANNSSAHTDVGEAIPSPLLQQKLRSIPRNGAIIGSCVFFTRGKRGNADTNRLNDTGGDANDSLTYAVYPIEPEVLVSSVLR